MHCSAHSADSRDVILSRRACDASRNLFRFPQSSCSAIVSAFPPVISTEARSETTSGAEKSLTLYDCFCNVHLPVFYTLTLLSPCKILRLRALLFARHFAQDDRVYRVYAACLKRSLPTACRRCLVPRTGVTTLLSLLCGQQRCHSEPPRMRCVEESASATAKQLQCNRVRIPPLSFRPKRGVKRRAERRNLSHCTIVFAMYICPCSIPSPYCHPARSFDFAPCYSLGASLRMTACTAFYAACLKRSLTTACRRRGVPAALFRESGVRSALFRESGIRSALFRERAILHCTTLFRGQRECPAARFRERALLHY